jgi:hypothetical protein
VGRVARTTTAADEQGDECDSECSRLIRHMKLDVAEFVRIPRCRAVFRKSHDFRYVPSS